MEWRAVSVGIGEGSAFFRQWSEYTEMPKRGDLSVPLNARLARVDMSSHGLQTQGKTEDWKKDYASVNGAHSAPTKKTHFTTIAWGCCKTSLRSVSALKSRVTSSNLESKLRFFHNSHYPSLRMWCPSRFSGLSKAERNAFVWGPLLSNSAMCVCKCSSVWLLIWFGFWFGLVFFETALEMQRKRTLFMWHKKHINWDFRTVQM